jgi:hypothetical protein
MEMTGEPWFWLREFQSISSAARIKYRFTAPLFLLWCGSLGFEV